MKDYERVEVEPQRGKSKLHLLHISPYKKFGQFFSTDPIGIRVLGGVVHGNMPTISQSLAVLRSGEGMKQAKNGVTSDTIQYIGLGMPLGSLDEGVEMLTHIDEVNRSRRLRENQPIQIFLGGNLPTNLRRADIEKLLDRFPSAIVVRGWGEEALVSLLKRKFEENPKDLRDIPGLVYKDENGIHATPLVSRRNPFNAKPLPVLLHPDVIGYIVGSENCSHPYCSFCARMPFQEKEEWDPRNENMIIEQMKDLSAIGIREATFTDEEFLGTSVEHAVEYRAPLAQTIVDAKRTGLIDQKFSFAASTRSDSIIKLAEAERLDILRDLKSAGLSLIFLGVESGISTPFERWDGLPIQSQTQRYGKGIRIEKHLAAVQILKQLGIGVEIGFIAFDPLLDLGEMKANAEFLLQKDILKNTPLVFQKLRLQEGAKYTDRMNAILSKLVRTRQIVEYPSLFGRFDSSTLQTEFRFFHPLIEKIVQLIEQIEGETINAIFTLKGYYHSNFITGEPIQGMGFETLTQLKGLDLKFSLGLIQAVQMSLSQRRIPLSKYDELTPYFESDQIIRTTIEAYKSERRKVWSNLLKSEIPEHVRQAVDSGLKQI